MSPGPAQLRALQEPGQRIPVALVIGRIRHITDLLSRHEIQYLALQCAQLQFLDLRTIARTPLHFDRRCIRCAGATTQPPSSVPAKRIVATPAFNTRNDFMPSPQRPALQELSQYNQRISPESDDTPAEVGACCVKDCASIIGYTRRGVQSAAWVLSDTVQIGGSLQCVPLRLNSRGACSTPPRTP